MGAIYRPRLADSHQVNAKRKCHHPSRHPSGESASSTKATATSPRPKYAPYVVQFRVTTNTPRNRQVLTALPKGALRRLVPRKKRRTQCGEEGIEDSRGLRVCAESKVEKCWKPA